MTQPSVSKCWRKPIGRMVFKTRLQSCHDHAFTFTFAVGSVNAAQRWGQICSAHCAYCDHSTMLQYKGKATASKHSIRVPVWQKPNLVDLYTAKKIYNNKMLHSTLTRAALLIFLLTAYQHHWWDEAAEVDEVLHWRVTAWLTLILI